MALPLRESLCVAKELVRDDQVLRGRAELLDRKDQDLIEAIFIRGQSTASVGRMLGVPARRVRDRAARLRRHLVSRKFLDAARALPYLPREEAALAKRRFCQQTTHRELCGEFGLTSHALRRRLDQLAAKIATIRRLQRGGLGRVRCSETGQEPDESY